MSTGWLWLAGIEAVMTAGSWLHHKATDAPWLGRWFLWHMIIPVSIAAALALWLHRATARAAGRAVVRWRIDDEVRTSPKQLPSGQFVRTFVEHGE